MHMSKKMREAMDNPEGLSAGGGGGGRGGRAAGQASAAGGAAAQRPGGSGGRSGRATQVKNRSPAPIQISAEQILREAHDARGEEHVKPPEQAIVDPEELAAYRLRKRKEFEDVIRRQRMSIGTWIKYAKWEESQKEFDRARSIWERCLEVDYRNEAVWLKYAEMEMKNRFVNHARNIWDRAVTLMPRVDIFWYRYAYMEEMLGNVAAARQIFERWMEWEPDHNAWSSYVKLELRHKNVERARQILQRFIICHNEVKSYLKLAKFEEKHGQPLKSREAFERAVKELGTDGNDPELFTAFADFEIRCKEYERARALYKYALDNIPKHRAGELFKVYTAFEKQYGDRAGVEDVVLSKKRLQYEEELKANPFNYDVWFDYIRLEESTALDSASALTAALPRIRDCYERAIAQIPPKAEKKYWKRYIYLWINYALFEELEAKDMDRAGAVWDKCLSVIPHTKFTFPTIWMHKANHELRRKRLDGARKVLGMAIGRCPKESLFKGYIDLEFRLGNIDRCRKLYEKYLEFTPENCSAWVRFAELESSLQEIDRSRAIFEIAIKQPVLDMPELLWKAYIDLEIRLGQHERVRALYARLLERTKHVKVWISRATFEGTIGQVARARPLFEEAERHFKAASSSSGGGGSGSSKEERVMLLEAWRDFELRHGDVKSIEAIAKRLPKKIKKKRQLKADDGTELGWEEYYDYLFPDETDKSANLKILEMARKWKKQKTADDTSAATAPAAAPVAAPATASASASASAVPASAPSAAGDQELDIGD